MIQYVFKDGPLTFKNAKTAKPQKIGLALAKIEKANAGKLTPRATVAAARDERSALHPHFEWDDAIAAEGYRVEQARTIISAIRVVEDDGLAQPHHAYLSVMDGAGVAYRSHGEIQRSAELQLAVLRQAERDLEAWERRHDDLVGACRLVNQARDDVRVHRETIESRASA